MAAKMSKAPAHGTNFQILSSADAGPSSFSAVAASYSHLSGHSGRRAKTSFGRDPIDEDDYDLDGFDGSADGSIHGDGGDEDGVDYSDGRVLATPGQTLGSLSTYMRGHGTHLVQHTGQTGPGDVASSLVGRVLLTNRLLSLQPFHTRYTPETGDLVLGRVLGVLPGARRWKVDLDATSQANLALSAINLPGGIQRRKLASDELQMRTFFKEGDLLVAEVQGVYGDGTTSLHTRSLRYGKLRNGRLVKVPCRLVKRGKSHFVRLQQHTSQPAGGSAAKAETIDMILGLNGWIWLSGLDAMRGGADPTNSSSGSGADPAQESQHNRPEAREAEGMGGKGVGRDVDAGGTYSDDLQLPGSETLASLSLLAALLSRLADAYLPISDASAQLAWDVACQRKQNRAGGSEGSTSAQSATAWWQGTTTEIKRQMNLRGLLGKDASGAGPGAVGAAGDWRDEDRMEED